MPFYEAWKVVCVISSVCSTSYEISPPSLHQVQQETIGVDLLGFELEKGDKERMGERVIAVGDQARTPYGAQNQPVLTTYR